MGWSVFVTVLITLLLTTLLHCDAAVSDSELTQIIQSLWNSDTNRLAIGSQVELDLQGYTYSSSNTDWAPEKLFKKVPSLTTKSTYKKFIDLLDNYVLYTDTLDQASVSEKSEQRVFVSSILGTTVWQLTREFLIRKGFVRSTTDLKAKLDDIWFREYSRTKGIVGSSGFEHVFVGELDRENKEISGAHNWVNTYLSEKNGKVNYMGYIKYDSKTNIYKLKLERGAYKKFSNSMFVGTSPEFEMALYTVCFFARPEDTCRFKLNSESVAVKTYPSYNSGLGSAYPLL